MLELGRTKPEVSVVGDQFGNPTSTKDLAKVILALADTRLFGIYHATCHGTCSWYEFACKIFELKGLDTKINKVTSEQFPRPAKRPPYSALENMMLKAEGLDTFRPWEEALADYLQELRL